MSFAEESYKKHAESYINVSDSEVKKYETWFDYKTVDLWRHERMFELTSLIVKQNTDKKWLTVGDGRFGTAARFINKIAALEVALPTDIDTRLLEVAKAKKWIKDFKYANAEQLPFKENEFDYSFVKQAYHHFPQPFKAIYEMIRVSKEAVVFNEPGDFLPSPVPRRIMQIIKNTLKSILGKNIPHHDTGNYEEVGNYIYSISEREFEKVALGLHLPAVAFKRFQDVYIAGVEEEMLNSNGPLYKKLKIQLVKNTFLYKLGLSNTNQLHAVIFKTMPNEKLIKELKVNNYKFIELPKCPY